MHVSVKQLVHAVSAVEKTSFSASFSKVCPKFSIRSRYWRWQHWNVPHRQNCMALKFNQREYDLIPVKVIYVGGFRCLCACLCPNWATHLSLFVYLHNLLPSIIVTSLHHLCLPNGRTFRVGIPPSKCSYRGAEKDSGKLRRERSFKMNGGRR